MASNYAEYFGIESIPAAAVFAALYAPFLAFYVYRSIRRTTYVFLILSLFCTIRITAFTMRALLAGSTSAGGNFKLLIANQVLAAVGFFSLLYSGYTLVLDRELLTGVKAGGDGIFGTVIRLVGDKRLYHVELVAGVGLGIAGATQASASNPTNGMTLRKASTVVFLLLTVLLGFRTILLARVEIMLTDPAREKGESKRSALVLCLIATILLVREVYATATMGNLVKQGNEPLWYPLYALPEILAVALYATPNLVPPRSELPK
ncbi:hypothetical protein L208DRAFT_1395915 [Tricholoma matsutake]|nr:hypothetical protein L208DRAFT_1395915 [Tricholoma matsutake 945]